MVNDYATRIIDLYTEYISWSAELMRSFGGVKIFSQLFTGGGQYKNREEHMIFFKAVEEVAGEYYAALKNGDAPRREAMEILYYVLIGCHGSVDEWGDWMLMAAEKHFVSFVDLLEKEEAAFLYEPYRRLRRRNKGLHPQEEIMKKLKKLGKLKLIVAHVTNVRTSYCKSSENVV